MSCKLNEKNLKELEEGAKRGQQDDDLGIANPWCQKALEDTTVVKEEFASFNKTKELLKNMKKSYLNYQNYPYVYI